ncbi:adenylate/guanylate cyclase domain-containing protein [Aestuariivirga litoralis]|uniref:Adenylate/guanylate cyclase domain-containing protein n=1 Tax=Aestuariivirga litoralis TaxID=2650924 RepID=A0A2W2BN77_9HYPH|nr:adenylate/guanylate cyclase domain-containing protein [Aestuariivirga litoralis]PZF77297.1 adenylate/guanylate cyclase domain-containing protein [Aestuariivirga litoralis]
MSEERQLLAMLIADVAGYSSLMARDEAATLSGLQQCQSLLERMVGAFGGFVVDTAGDGMLAAFPSSVRAAECAIAVQTAMREEAASTAMQLRIGVNVGEVVRRGTRIFGDAVNVAARIAAVAEPGSVVLSANAHEQVHGKITARFTELGAVPLKNIENPPRLFALAGGTSDKPPSAGTPDAPVRQAIAVIPFANLSDDPAQEYFSDGISEDIITDLSKIGALSVVSRNTSFAMKGKTLAVPQMSREVGARYVLHGSVRKSGSRLRISASLGDGATGTNLWAERFDRDMTDIFAMQDEISAAIVSALRLTLLPEEKRAIERRGTQSIDAYNLLLQARFFRYSNTAKDTRQALQLAQQAIAFDPRYAEAWAVVAAAQIALHEMTGGGDTGLAAAESALRLDGTLALAHAARGRVLCGLGRYEDAFAAHRLSETLDPDSYDVQFLFGRTCTELGEAQSAIDHLEAAARIAEGEFLALALAIQSYNALGRRAEAADASRRTLARIERILAQRPDDASALFHGSSVLAELGRRDAAIAWADRALAMAPDEPRGAYLLACTYALLGETEQAVELLHRAVQQMQPRYVTWVRNDTDLESLRDHPRYKAIIAEMERRLERDETG